MQGTCLETGWMTQKDVVSDTTLLCMSKTAYSILLFSTLPYPTTFTCPHRCLFQQPSPPTAPHQLISHTLNVSNTSRNLLQNDAERFKIIIFYRYWPGAHCRHIRYGCAQTRCAPIGAANCNLCIPKVTLGLPGNISWAPPLLICVIHVATAINSELFAIFHRAAPR